MAASSDSSPAKGVSAATGYCSCRACTRIKNNSVLLLVLLMLLASGCKCLQFQAAEKLTVDELDTPASTWHVSAAENCTSFPMLELHLYLLSGLMMCRNEQTLVDDEDKLMVVVVSAILLMI